MMLLSKKTTQNKIKKIIKEHQGKTIDELISLKEMKDLMKCDGFFAVYYDASIILKGGC